jgi:predicted DNA-binding protein (UPF0251 family)
MSRPLKPRNCACPHRAGYSAVYKPAGIPLKDMEITHLALDELESLHLCDGEGMNQEQAGVCMGVSRGTVQRLLASARSKVAQALVGQKALAIAGEKPAKEILAAAECPSKKLPGCTKGTSQ